MKNEFLDMKLLKKHMRNDFFRKFHTKFERWDILIILTLILFVQVLVIIHFSEWKLWGILNNDFFKRLLVPEGEDRTLYNIAISYVAAYIFYVLQVHIPAYLTYKSNISLYRVAFESEMEILEEVLFVAEHHEAGETYHKMQLVTDDLVQEVEKFQYDDAYARLLIKKMQDKRQSNMDRILALDMDNTVKMLYRNMLTNISSDYPKDFTFLDMSGVQDSDILTIITIIANLYIANKAELLKYGFVSDYVFLTDEQYQENGCVVKYSKQTYKEIQRIRTK